LTDYTAVETTSSCTCCSDREDASLRASHMPDFQKFAIVYPQLKKSSLDPTDRNLYRPISNLSYIFKLVERVEPHGFFNMLTLIHSLFHSKTLVGA